MAGRRLSYGGVFPDNKDLLEGSEPIAVHVGSGDAKKVWHPSEKLLKCNSTFFTAALEGGFAEGISKTVTLPEVDPEIFGNFIEWLHVGFDQEAEWDSDSLVLMWVLGDILGCPLMQDDVMCKLIKNNVEHHIETDILQKIYELSTPESKLHRFVIGQCLYDIRYVCPGLTEDKCAYLQFLEINEHFAHELAQATILLGNERPKDPCRDLNPYLCAASSSASKPISTMRQWEQSSE